MVENIRRATLTGLLISILAACSGDNRSPAVGGAYTGSARSQAEDRGYYKVGKPYQVAGRWYYPREDFSFAETGTASWYGPDFQGQPTANGETYDMYARTAAHRTLQMPSVVRVVNLDNGRETVVRINDRGPFARDRIIDLSRLAAEELGMTGRGTAQVRVEVLAEESQRIAELAKSGADQGRLDQFMARRFDERGTGTYIAKAAEPQLSNPYMNQASVTTASLAPIQPSASPSPARLQRATYEVPVRSGSLFVQAGAFSQRENAERLKSELSRFGDARIDNVDLNGRMLHRVRLGPLDNPGIAQTTLAQLVQGGFVTAQMVVE